MNKKQKELIKIIIDSKIYIPINEIYKKFKCNSQGEFIEKYKDIILTFKPRLGGKYLLETEYNKLIAEDEMVEMTAFRTLKSEYRSQKGMSQLAIMLTGNRVEFDDEYIKNKALESFNQFNDKNERYLKDTKQAQKYEKLIKPFGLSLIYMTEISRYDASASLSAYIVGNGIFIQKYLFDCGINDFNFSYENEQGEKESHSRVEFDKDGNVLYLDENSGEYINLTQSVLDDRDYSEFKVSENLSYVLSNYRHLLDGRDSTDSFLSWYIDCIKCNIDSDLGYYMVCGFNHNDKQQHIYIDGILEV